MAMVHITSDPEGCYGTIEVRQQQDAINKKKDTYQRQNQADATAVNFSCIWMWFKQAMCHAIDWSLHRIYETDAFSIGRGLRRHHPSSIDSHPDRSFVEAKVYLPLCAINCFIRIVVNTFDDGFAMTIPFFNDRSGLPSSRTNRIMTTAVRFFFNGLTLPIQDQ
jgi:hypothetical protein